MASRKSLGSLDFLPQDPVRVQADGSARGDEGNVLPAKTIDALMRIPGVDGVWVEVDAQGRREVVIYVADPKQKVAVPTVVAGMATRIIGGEPIRALQPQTRCAGRRCRRGRAPARPRASPR